ncbi:MAG: A/G-specific adenine glycosylase [Clostridium sp.]|nr:A/G-specific adenine glycosylase [Acetatifactor muris]MCM1526804.1 A/G-specific adenine glycosylase [Bacteroides sp.]MCM1562995.1 A/G-specific adenine glycosylase [Clostridium sp.]
MKYQTIAQAEFVERPNRFVAYVQLEGHRVKAHVKNTGRCRELLRPGAKVILAKSDNPNRATAYDLVAVEKDGRMVNMDSQAPNQVVREWLMRGGLFHDLILVRPETVYGQSRLDFYLETPKEKVFLEVKGVTLEEDGVARFPDAPSERALKHLQELIRAKREGYRACVLFVIQMKGVRYLLPNWDTHKAFGEELTRAREAGVELYAYDCHVTEDGLEIGESVPVFVNEEEAAAEFGPKFGKDLEISNKKLRMGDLFAIPQPLLNRYDKSRRILPWRENPTAYRVWVSEIMLQQTRVEAVKPYFERFVQKLPDVAALAAVEEETLLKLWEGLGYYNRARNLQRTAVRIMEEHGGQIPADYGSLLALPGIGSYTAGAILSIAMGLRYPAVDGNVLRVLSRFRMDQRLISDAKVKKAVEEELAQVIPEDRPGDFNQAVMELGACVCVPGGAPRCGECPIARWCMAHAAGAEQEYPVKAAHRERGVEEKTILVIRDGSRTAVRRRKGRGLLAGMYEFPTLEGFCTAEEVVAYLADNGLKSIRVQPLEEAKHVFTHREWHMKGYMVRVDELEPARPHGDTADWIYIRPEEVRERYPIPSAFAAYTKVLNMRLGKKNFEEEP